MQSRCLRVKIKSAPLGSHAQRLSAPANPATTTKPNLQGYKLTDEEDGSNAWAFPAVVLQPQQYLLVLLSGRNSSGGCSMLLGARQQHWRWAATELLCLLEAKSAVKFYKKKR